MKIKILNNQDIAGAIKHLVKVGDVFEVFCEGVESYTFNVGKYKQYIKKEDVEVMKKMYTIQEIIDNGYVIHTPEEEQAIKLCNHLHSLGMKWHGGDSYKEYTHWDAREENTYYDIKKNMYGSVIFLGCKDTIINFDQVDFEEDLPKIDNMKEEKKMTKLEMKNYLKKEIREIRSWQDGIEETIETIEKQIDILKGEKKHAQAEYKGYESQISELEENIKQLDTDFVLGERINVTTIKDDEGNRYFIMEDETLVNEQKEHFTFTYIEDKILIFKA